MKKYRHLINIGLLLTQLVLTLNLIFYIVLDGSLPSLRNLINFIFIGALIFMLYKNKNVFTLLLGITLVLGNFSGLSAFAAVTTSGFWLHISSISIPLYWGQKFYSLLLLLYLIFNKDFFIGIASKKYWQDFKTRTHDLEPLIETIKVESEKTTLEKKQD